MQRSYPSSASRRAMAWPIPRLEPVMIADLASEDDAENERDPRGIREACRAVERSALLEKVAVAMIATVD